MKKLPKYKGPTSLDMECVIANKYDYRQHLIVPNVRDGLNIHECDLLIMTKSGYCHEVEIKVSKSDLKKDATKKHAHKSDKIKYLWFALPEKLQKFIDLVPAHAGIYIVKEYSYHDIFGTVHNKGFTASILRMPEANRYARPLSDKDQIKLMRLGCMRIWPLKHSVKNNLNDKTYWQQKSERQERALKKKFSPSSKFTQTPKEV